MDIIIKNMVCKRCILAVTEIFSEVNIGVMSVKLGKVQTTEEVSQSKLDEVNVKLKKIGFEIITDNKRRLIERIKNIVIDYVYHYNDNNKFNFSTYLSEKMHLGYPYLATLFSSVEGITIEKYLINLKIERVKELLVYDEKTLSEIAYEMGYSSVAHLSSQFKKVTDFTPSYFKKFGDQKRKPISNV